MPEEAAKPALDYVPMPPVHQAEPPTVEPKEPEKPIEPEPPRNEDIHTPEIKNDIRPPGLV